MTAKWNWAGSRWWRFDFHAHTPASDDYGRGPDQEQLKSLTPKEWLLDYMKAGIDCVAITDHNTGAWIDRLKEALRELESEQPDGYRPLYLFPGVEISAYGGIHVLAILRPEATSSDVGRLLGAVRFWGPEGSSEVEAQASFPEVVRAISGAGGIAIPAHVDGDKGLFRLTGATLRQALECRDVVAMEVANPDSARPQALVDRQFAWAEVIGSDAHHPTDECARLGPGKRFTWIKMATPSLEGLRLALLDGPLSVRRSDRQPDDPNAHAELVIESFKVEQARYMGRSRPFSVVFNPWLNTIIGSRGTGKSTLVEFLRTCLRREGEIPPALEADLKKYQEEYTRREDEGLLTDNTRLTVVYRKNGVRYRVQWSKKNDLEPIEVEQEPGNWRPEQGDVAQRFPVRIYSQKQIFELAKAPLALLKIVDEALEVDRRSWEEQSRVEEASFLKLRAQEREIGASLADEPRLKGELEDVKRKLAVLEEARYADVLKEYQRRLDQRHIVEDWEKTWSSSGQQLRELAANLVPGPLDARLFDENDDADRALLAESRAILTGLEGMRAKLEELARDFDNLLARWRNNLQTSPWTQAVAAAITRYDELRRQLAGAEDPEAYGKLLQRRQDLEDRLKAFDERRRRMESIRRDAEASLRRLLELRRELTNRRINFLQKVLQDNPYVRIRVVPYGAKEMVESEFRRLIQRETGFEKDIGTVDGGEGLIGNLYAGNSGPDEFEQRLAALKRKVRDLAAGRYEASELRDQRFAGHFRKLPPEALDRLDAWFPEDTLYVEYSTTGDGSNFRPIQEGSPGQKTAALLAFLLSYGEEPIILDQPEDDLDNLLIHNLIVTQIREIKQHRQMIVVTHNANIVVNGDAELVVALTVGGGETHHKCVGSLQEKNVRDTICAVMEGGREAFEQRYRRIALESHHAR